jgi:hypothetical protein
METCKAGHYTSNDVVTHFPILCFGYNYRDGTVAQPKCQWLVECAEERIKPLLTPRRWKNFVKKFGGQNENRGGEKIQN